MRYRTLPHYLILNKITYDFYSSIDISITSFEYYCTKKSEIKTLVLARKSKYYCFSSSQSQKEKSELHHHIEQLDNTSHLLS